MKTLIKNGKIVNVFTDELEETNVLIEDGIIVGVGDYCESDADIIEDASGKYISPGFIDGHIHVESTMLMPAELSRICAENGTTAIVTDPHEIANVCGRAGIDFMIEASRNLPIQIYFTLPSCVPSTGFDESGAVLKADDLSSYYGRDNVIGLAEMMNYPGVLAGDEEVMKKISDALSKGLSVSGHAPLLSGRGLDKYISAGVQNDHECSSFEEALERIRKGQWVMIREGTAARNLDALLPLFDEPFSRRCLLVTDDKHPHDILNEGHINGIIRKAVIMGKSPLTAIRAIIRLLPRAVL